MKKKALITGVHVQDVPSPKLTNIDRINSLSWEYKHFSEAGLIKACQWLVDNRNKFRS